MLLHHIVFFVFLAGINVAENPNNHLNEIPHILRSYLFTVDFHYWS